MGHDEEHTGILMARSEGDKWVGRGRGGHRATNKEEEDGSEWDRRHGAADNKGELRIPA